MMIAHRKISLNFYPLLFLFFFCLYGCIPESESPLSNSEASRPDESLYGVWFGKDDDQSLIYLHIGQTSSGEMGLIYIEHKRNSTLDQMVFSMFPTMIDETHYLNVHIENPDIPIKGYIFFKYEITGKDNLTIWLINYDYVRKAIENGSLKGTIEKGLLGSVRITDTTTNLVNFIAKTNQNDLFKRILQLKRLH